LSFDIELREPEKKPLSSKKSSSHLHTSSGSRVETTSEDSDENNGFNIDYGDETYYDLDSTNMISFEARKNIFDVQIDNLDRSRLSSDSMFQQGPRVIENNARSMTN